MQCSPGHSLASDEASLRHLHHGGHLAELGGVGGRGPRGGELAAESDAQEL